MLNSKIDLHPQFLREYSFLQLRKICEIVALACLVAHGDITRKLTKSIYKSYDPASILNQLEILHPDFFPVPVEITWTPDEIKLGDYTKPYMSKQELLKLWGRTGDILHRGSFKKLMAGPVDVSMDFSDVTIPGQKILHLLSQHKISRIGNKFHFLGFLDYYGDSSVFIATAP